MASVYIVFLFNVSSLFLYYLVTFYVYFSHFRLVSRYILHLITAYALLEAVAGMTEVVKGVLELLRLVMRSIGTCSPLRLPLRQLLLKRNTHLKGIVYIVL